MAKLIKNIGEKQKKVSHEEASTLLGAEFIDKKTRHTKGMQSLVSLREFTRGKLHSTGGRPSLENVEKVRRKISFFEGDFLVLEELANKFSDQYRKVTPSQIAACIVRKELKNLKLSGREA